MDEEQRLNAEWLALNAFRGLTKLAAKGDLSKGTYDNALELGGELYPELLGPNTSLLRRERESDTVKEYRQLAHLRSLKQGQPVAYALPRTTPIQIYADSAGNSQSCWLLCVPRCLRRVGSRASVPRLRDWD